MSAVRPCTSRFDASAPFRSSTAQTLAAPTAAEAISAVRPSLKTASTSDTLARTSSTQTWPSIAAIRGDVTQRASGAVTSTPAASKSRKALASPLRAAAQGLVHEGRRSYATLEGLVRNQSFERLCGRSCCEAKSTATRNDAAA